jgi:FtsZ-binding cell division protein ZapB
MSLTCIIYKDEPDEEEMNHLRQEMNKLSQDLAHEMNKLRQDVAYLQADNAFWKERFRKFVEGQEALAANARSDLEADPRLLGSGNDVLSSESLSGDSSEDEGAIAVFCATHPLIDDAPLGGEDNGHDEVEKDKEASVEKAVGNDL